MGTFQRTASLTRCFGSTRAASTATPEGGEPPERLHGGGGQSGQLLVQLVPCAPLWAILPLHLLQPRERYRQNLHSAFFMDHRITIKLHFFEGIPRIQRGLNTGLICCTTKAAYSAAYVKGTLHVTTKTCRRNTSPAGRFDVAQQAASPHRSRELLDVHAWQQVVNSDA